MRGELPWLPWFFSGSADLAALDAGKKHARQARLAGMALAMHRTQIEELIAECVALLLLREDVLQRESQFAESGSFGPRTFALFVFNQRNIRKKSAPAVRALFETRPQLLREYEAQCVELILFYCVAGVHACTGFLKATSALLLLHLRRCAADRR